MLSAFLFRVARFVEVLLRKLMGCDRLLLGG